jgi:aspartate racemase
MKKIGIVGGVGWRATAEYYSGLCERSEELDEACGTHGASFPEMVIESLDLGKAIALLGNDSDEASWAAFDEYHRSALRRLEMCGAETAAMASNSPHHRFESITRGVGIPVVDLFEAAARECARMGARQVLILGTPLIMASERLRAVLGGYGIEAAGPRDESSRALTAALIADLQRGRMDGAEGRLADIAWPAFEDQFEGLPVVCLACTELPLAFPQFKSRTSFEFYGARYVSTTAAHIAAIFASAGEASSAA